MAAQTKRELEENSNLCLLYCEVFEKPQQKSNMVINSSIILNINDIYVIAVQI